jgi:hypothetical protein
LVCGRDLPDDPGTASLLVAVIFRDVSRQHRRDRKRHLDKRPLGRIKPA